MKKIIKILSLIFFITNISFNFSMEKPAPTNKEISLWEKFIDKLNTTKASKLISKYEIDVNAPISLSNIGEENPLFFIALAPIYFVPSESVNKDSIQFLQLLLNHNANPNFQNQMGNTILHELINVIDQIKQDLIMNKSMLVELRDSRKYGTIEQQRAHLDESIATDHIQLNGLVSNLKAICSNKKTDLNIKNNEHETALELAKNIEKTNAQYPIYRNLSSGITEFKKTDAEPNVIEILESCEKSKINNSKD